MTELYVLIGVAGIGKSTWARNNAADLKAEIVSTDAIRAELLGNEADQSNQGLIWSTAFKRTERLLREGKNVIFDATNLTKKDRKKFFIKYRGLCDRILAVCFCGYKKAIEQDARRSRHVGHSVIFRQFMKLQKPSSDEGWDGMLVLPPNYENETEVSGHDICVCCGEYVPEGTQVCAKCAKEWLGEKDDPLPRNLI